MSNVQPSEPECLPRPGPLLRLPEVRSRSFSAALDYSYHQPIYITALEGDSRDVSQGEESASRVRGQSRFAREEEQNISCARQALLWLRHQLSRHRRLRCPTLAPFTRSHERRAKVHAL